MELLLLAVYSLALLVLLLFGLHGISLLYHYSRLRGGDPPTPSIPEDDDLPVVTVQLPLFNERFVAERLVAAVCRLDYPRHLLEIQLLDDSTDETREIVARLCAERRAEGFDIHHLHRTDRSGFKAGALRDGLAQARGSLVAIFDADFLPEPDFLRRTVPHFTADPTVGLVQGRWEHLNLDYSLLTRLQGIALDAHFVMEQQVRNRASLFMNFNGTAGIWRRDCIVDAGDWQEDTLTEDLDLSYRAQLKGWRFLYLNELTVPAELPSEINGLKSQQFRWTKGAIETARKHLPALWRSKLPLRVKLHATAHLTSNLVFPCILLVGLLNVPVLLVKISRPDLEMVFNAMGVCAIASVATTLFYLTAQRAVRGDWRRRVLLIPVSLAGTMGLAVNNTRGVIEALMRRRSPFERTPKYNIVHREDSWRESPYRLSRVGFGVLLELALAAYFIGALIISLRHAELSQVPFQLMFLFGFGLTGLLSLLHAFQSSPARIKHDDPD